MATYPKIADNEMNYFQFKAKQMLLLKKEEQEWKDFCRQVAPECEACLAEKEDLKLSKDVGIQAFPGKSVNKIERPFSQPRHTNEQIPEALNNIKIRLENIDLALSKMYDLSYEIEKEKKPSVQERSCMPVTPVYYNEQRVKLSEEQRRLLIHKSLRTSLEKLHSSKSAIPKKSPNIKPKNSSYFIPHDLQVKRAASRKAYLASLQTKPKVSFQNMRQSTNKTVGTSETKKGVLKHPSKSRKKVITKDSSMDNEETLVKAFVADDAKDDNIESVVDAILEDLLGETALDLNKIKQMKREKNSNMPQKKIDLDKAKRSSIPSSPISKDTVPKVAAIDNKGIRKLKCFLDSSEKTQQETDSSKKEQIMHNNAVISGIKDSKSLLNGILSEKSFDGTLQFGKNCEMKKNTSKFICDISQIITINPEEVKQISYNRDRFWRYLRNNIFQRLKGNYNPTTLNRLAEQILDDCINDVAQELSELPSKYIDKLYNQEFVQQVES